MTVVNLNRKELEKAIGKIDKEVEEKIAGFGATVEESNEKEISIEVYPNRPDLLSLQGVARALGTYLNGAKTKEYKINKPEKNYKVIIEKSVKKVRPYTVCAIVKNLKFNDEKIKEIIDIQEKLHITIGRKRKKLAIGIYPLEKIKLPITFSAKKPEDIKFIPLEAEREMNGKQILRSHPAGREYADLLKDEEVFPIFSDASGKILSMPPIINSHETGKIIMNTKDIFIECSGFNLPYLKKTLNILVCALADMGGEIYYMEIDDSENKTPFLSPNLDNEKMQFKIEDINRTLGLNLNEEEIIKCLAKMGIGYSKGEAIIPAYRTDILHWVDLAEEVGIAYGYENFKPEIPKISTIAEEDKKSIVKRKIEEILSGLNFLEASSYHLTTKESVKNVYFDFKDFIEVEESKTEYSVLRPDLFTNLMKILSENTDSSYPHRIFEIGKVFGKDKESETGIIEKERLGIAIADENTNFTEIKQVLDYLFKMINKTYEIKDYESSALISGRTGSIFVDGKEVGVLGEVHPRVLKNLKIRMPVSILEINLGFLSN